MGLAAARQQDAEYKFLIHHSVKRLDSLPRLGRDPDVHHKHLAAPGRCTEQAQAMFSILSGMEIAVVEFEADPVYLAERLAETDLLVDAIYGTGFYGELDEHILSSWLQWFSSAPLLQSA